MNYAKPQYSREQVDAAGEALVMPPLWRPEYEDAVKIVNNWRMSHGFPLNTFQMTLKAYAKDIDIDCLLAQRTKRLPSIKIKLERFRDWLKLSDMQDLGGCRAVMKSIGDVDALVARYKDSRVKHRLQDEDDYIRNPKKSGYRGIHLIYSYHSDRKATYNGLRIEIQVRTVNMHAWATAVETVDTFSQQGLKVGQGRKEWQRFFALMGTYFATVEGMPPVPNTPSVDAEWRLELRELAAKLDVVNRLTAYGEAVKAYEAPDAPADAHYYVLSLQPGNDASKVFIYAYSREELTLAEEKEQELASAGSDVVLVGVDSIEALHRAYPNYFLDTRLFVDSVRSAIG